MRHLMLCTFFFLIALACAAQDSSSFESRKKVSYLQRSRDQKAGGILLCAAGAVGALGTLISDVSQFGTGLVTTVASFGTASPKYRSLKVGYIVSGVAFAGGVYLLTASERNKRKGKATSVTIGMEKTEVLKYNAVYKKSFPAVSLSIRI